MACIKPKSKNKDHNKDQDLFKNYFITTYSKDQKIVRNIIKKYWHIHRGNPYLKDNITKQPRIVFRRAKTLKNVLAPSDFMSADTDVVRVTSGVRPGPGMPRITQSEGEHD